MKSNHCYNVYFPRFAAAPPGKVQGFWSIQSKTLAPEQSQMALKALAFKAFTFVLYTLQ